MLRKTRNHLQTRETAIVNDVTMEVVIEAYKFWSDLVTIESNPDKLLEL